VPTYYGSTANYPNVPEDFISVPNPGLVNPGPVTRYDSIITGTAGADNLTGTSGNDKFEASGGNDLLSGGLGDDSYYVTVGDQVADDGGIDTVYFTGSGFWRLSPDIENIVAYGTGPVDFRGNNDANVMIGGDGNDYFNGRAGDDKFYGMGGNDTIDMSTGRPASATSGVWTMGNRYIDGGDGIDTLDYDGGAGDGAGYVRSAVTVDLGAGTASGGGDFALGSATLVSIENVSAGVYDDWLRGSSVANHLYGRGGNDTLIGVGGNDILDGGNGNDSYYVTPGDVLVDASGTDTVYSSYTWTLATGFENLSATGTAAIQLHGNNGANVLTGNDAGDYFNSRAGDDTMFGGAGNDNFDMSTGGIGNIGTRSINGGAGIDTLDYDGYARSAVTVDLSAGTASGGGTGGTGRATLASIERAVGGAYNDSIAGSAGDNELFGRGGNDVLHGGAGSDTLWGGVGDDTLAGGAGNDVLSGSFGNDTYQFGRGDGADAIREANRGGDGWWADNATVGDSDTLQLGAGIAVDQVWFERSGNDLVTSVIGTADRVTIHGWYAGAENRVERFTTASGAVLLESQVQNLVDAMAAFAPPAAGVTTLPAEYSSLETVIAANWQ
jgi:Ca2+-binding RTX toxin-like protein